MDLNLLSTFVVVAETESFSAAATKLGVIRSSVSRAIASLERELDVQLFARTTRHVALTTAGTALYARVAPQLASLRDALGALPEREQIPSGTLRLTAPVDVGAIVLPDVLAAFSMRYPEVQLDMRLTNRHVDVVAEGFDAALRVMPSRRADSSLVTRKLSALEMNVFASPTYLARAGTPRSAREAGDHAWVGFTSDALRRTLAPIEQAKPPKPHLPLKWASDDVLFVAKAVVAGVGLGLLPTFLLREDLAAGRVVRVLPRVAVPAGGLYFVYPPSRHLPRKLTALRDFLIAHFDAHPLLASGAQRSTGGQLAGSTSTSTSTGASSKG